MMNRRTLITGLISFVTAPAIVRATSLMPVKVLDESTLTWYQGIPIRTIRTGLPPPTWRLIHQGGFLYSYPQCSRIFKIDSLDD